MSWLSPPLPDDNNTVSRKLATKGDAEIVARLLRRAELHEQAGGYPARCSPLDRDAARRMCAMMRAHALSNGGDATAVDDEIQRLLGLLREP
jgi:hypothetical protein